MVKTLTVVNHDRDAFGYRYVYPVLSRRAGGISLGINLNWNNACNWRCAYCQVPDLTRGQAPEVDLRRLETELLALLAQLASPGYLEALAPEGMRRLNDLALSGNGEPTSAEAFEAVIRLIGRVKTEVPLAKPAKLVLITNGSFVDRAGVQAGLRLMKPLSGEVWFKLDRGSSEAIAEVNGLSVSLKRHVARLKTAAALCPTWVQSCWFEAEDRPLPLQSEDAFVQLMAEIKAESPELRGVLLYGLARPPAVPGGERLRRLPESRLQALAQRLEAAGLQVKVTP